MSDLVEKHFAHSHFLPFDETVSHYRTGIFGFAAPWSFTGWEDEAGAIKHTAALHAGLNPTTTYRVKGPDALKFLMDTCVNSFANFPIGSGKHAIMCNDKGQVMTDGVLVRLGEDEFITYWLAPYIAYAFEKGNYNAVGEDLTGKVYLFQLSGPRSLDIIQDATGEDLRDLKFMRSRECRIGDAKFSVLRMGMGGSLAYELHGLIEDAKKVHAALIAAGEKYGIRKLGQGQYTLSHTESGYSQVAIHFLYPWGEDADFLAWQAKLAGGQEKASSGGAAAMRLRGSLGDDMRLRYANPFQLGWGKMVRFDHDFVGRAALEREAANPTRQTVTLKWNVDDILDVMRSQFGDGEKYRFMDMPMEPSFDRAGIDIYSDIVEKDGRAIGTSAGRIFSVHYRDMISLAMIDVDQAAIGNEVEIVWGEPGTRQKKIRATVERFPYFNEGRNQDIDTSTLARPA